MVLVISSRWMGILDTVLLVVIISMGVMIVDDDVEDGWIRIDLMLLTSTHFNLYQLNSPPNQRSINHGYCSFQLTKMGC